MENLAIARIFSEIADLLEIKNENPFKIRAYRNASETIAHATRTSRASRRRQAARDPGIGKDLAAKIREIAETGDARFHRELLEQFPPTVLDLLHLQGVGPRRSHMLYTELGIKTIEELEAACADGRVRGLKGLGKKKEQLILKACAERKQHTRPATASRRARGGDAAARLSPRGMPDGRVRYTSAASAAARRPPVTSTFSHRSLNQAREMGMTRTVMSTFTTYKLVERILGQGDTKSSVRLLGRHPGGPAARA